jgi:formylglycine-generating enzyme required for sulfatase activity
MIKTKGDYIVRMNRGGSYSDFAWRYHSANGSHIGPDYRLVDIGFRLVRPA